MAISWTAPWTGSQEQVQQLSALLGTTFSPDTTWLAGPGNYQAPNDFYSPQHKSASQWWEIVGRYGPNNAKLAYQQELQYGQYNPATLIEGVMVPIVGLPKAQAGNVNVSTVNNNMQPTQSSIPSANNVSQAPATNMPMNATSVLEQVTGGNSKWLIIGAGLILS